MVEQNEELYERMTKSYVENLWRKLQNQLISCKAYYPRNIVEQKWPRDM